MLSINWSELERKSILDRDHKWGYQIRMLNEPEYCAKVMVLENTTPGSLHRHQIKKESFVCLNGCATVDVELNGTFESFVLYPGDTVTVPRNARHRMQAIRVAILLEVSTHDDDDDIVRDGDPHGR